MHGQGPEKTRRGSRKSGRGAQGGCRGLVALFRSGLHSSSTSFCSTPSLKLCRTIVCARVEKSFVGCCLSVWIHQFHVQAKRA